MERKRRPLLAAFCIPTAIMLAVIVYKQIYPFGDRCFLRVDMYNQYMPFFTEFHRKLREGGSLTFSWNAGLGANFTALYAYYLASPVNWLLVLCPSELIIEFMTLLIVIKIGLCGLTFAWYLKKHFGTDDYAITLFSVFYALSGYLSAYNWNIMWLDCIVLTPVIILGLEELVLQRKPLLYCLSLGLSILTNYYISIFICIFLVLYAAMLMLPLSLREKGRSLFDFTVYSLLSGGMASIVLLPAALALRATRFDQADFPSKVKIYFNLFSVIARHCINVATEIRNDHWPNIYCGVAVFLLLPLYFICRRIRWQEKLPKLFLLLFFYLSFSVNILEFLWHGLNFPDSLPARQSFLYIFLVLTMCFEAFLQLRTISGRWILAVTGGGVLFLLLCMRFQKDDAFTMESFLLTGFYLMLYALLLYWYSREKLRSGMAFVLLACMVMMESALNTAQTSVSTTSRSQYRKDCQTNAALLASLGGMGNGFYRIEEFDRMTKNDGMLADFPTATLFSSTVSESMTHLYKRLGMSSSKVFYSYEGATPLSSALLSVNYMFSDSLEITDRFHELLEKKQGEYLYRNKYTLPLGYMVPADLEENWELEIGNPIDVQNSLAWAVGMKKPLFTRIEVKEQEGSVTIPIAENGYVYVYPEKCSTKDIKADIAGYEKTYEKVYYPHILDIGWCDAGSEVILSQSGDKRDEENSLKACAYRIDLAVLRRVVQRLASQPMTIEDFSDTYVRGKILAREDGVLATSIPNEDGWSVLVDGRACEIKPFSGAMVSVPLSAGEHTVEFSYTPPGLFEGRLISLASLFLFALLAAGRRRARAKAR